MQIKYHKPEKGFPGREVVAQTGDATYHLSKELTRITQPLVERLPSFIRNTDHLVQLVDQVTVLPGNFLFSMDVVAMYPSVQREPALREMEDQLSKDPKLKERTTWKPKQIKRLAEVCFETHFVFIWENVHTIRRNPDR